MKNKRRVYKNRLNIVVNMSMYGEVDVFISNYTLVDPEIYQLWIDGHCGM